METIRVLIFNWRCWLNPDMGGAEVFTREVARRWAKHGHEVTLFTSEFPDCKREENVDDVRIVRAGGKYSVYWRAKKYYRKYFSKDGYDVVIDEINTRPFFAPKFVDNRKKIIALIHQLAREYWFYETPFPISYIGYHFLEKKWLKNYVNFTTVTVSESTRQDLLDLGFKEVFVVSEGVNFEALNRFPEKERYPVVVYMGRLKRAKRPDHLLRAFELIEQEMPEARLWVIGDGYMKKELERIALDGVDFFGYVSEEEKIDLLSRAWVIANPSICEGFGLNVVEAAACGTPCVAYDVPGLRDSVKRGETGLLVESGDIEGFADALIRMLKDDELREMLSRNALEYSKGFSWDTSAREFMKVLQRVL